MFEVVNKFVVVIEDFSSIESREFTVRQQSGFWHSTVIDGHRVAPTTPVCLGDK
jgi:hypothetical protein